jgi:hypothetical protein
MNKSGKSQDNKKVCNHLQPSAVLLCKISVLLCLCVSIFVFNVFGQISKYEDRPIQNVISRVRGSDRSTSSAAELKLSRGKNREILFCRSASAARSRRPLHIKIVFPLKARRAKRARGDLRCFRQTKKNQMPTGFDNRRPERRAIKGTKLTAFWAVNLLNPGAAVTEQTLKNNADLILEYLRDRGFFNAEVTYSQQQQRVETRVAVTFNVNPNAQARIENFNINIDGFDAAKARERIKLKPRRIIFARAFKRGCRTHQGRTA